MSIKYILPFKNFIHLSCIHLVKFKFLDPQNPYPWLFTVYGTDCLDIAYYQIMHEENTYSRVPLILSEKHKSPALPTGPLLDRVK